MAPIIVEYVPTGQGEAAFEFTGQYDPAGHAVGVVAPVQPFHPMASCTLGPLVSLCTH